MLTTLRESTKSLIKIKSLYWLIIIIGILLIAFLIRVQGAKAFAPNLLASPDSYHYYWQAQIILEQGQLPARDMNRWLPLGRDLNQTLNLYSYILAYSYKGLRLVFPNISLYLVTLYAPAVCFVIGLGALCLFLYHIKGCLFSISVGGLLATLPGSIDRSIAGFSDRDSWCLMLGILAVTTYLTSLRTQKPRNRFLWTVVSGFIMFLGGMSWEGFGVFLIILLFVELWRFLSSETETDLGLYLIWVCTFVPALWLASPAYRSGQGFATHISALMLMSPLVILGIRTLRILFIKKVSWVTKHRPVARMLSLGLIIVSLTLALGYVLVQYNTFADTTVPFGQNQLMESVHELKPTDLNFWAFRYGSVFLFGSFGFILINMQWWKKNNYLLAVPPALFAIITFLQGRFDVLLKYDTLFFLSAIALFTLTLLFIAWTRKETIENESVTIAFIAWFFLWIALARGAQRYDFFTGIPLAFFAIEAVIHIAQNISRVIKWKKGVVKVVTAVVILVVILFYQPLGGHATRAIYTATQIRQAAAKNNISSFLWMRRNLESDAIVACDWSYGSMLNVLAGVKTIIDQDHYIQYWIHLYNKHVLHATSEDEVLEFLKTHDVTHIMLITEKDLPRTFLHGRLSNAFVPIYPSQNFSKAKVKIWKIDYPPNIQSRPEYLSTKPKK